MENLERLKLNNGRYQDVTSVRNRSKSKIKTKSVTINFTRLRKNLIILNTCIIVLLFILLGVGYSEQVEMSSDNLILQNNISDLSTQVNSLDQIAQSYNSSNRVEKIAQSSLNMIYPSDEDIVKTKNNNEKLITLNDFLIEEQVNNSKSIYTVLTNMFE